MRSRHTAFASLCPTARRIRQRRRIPRGACLAVNRAAWQPSAAWTKSSSATATKRTGRPGPGRRLARPAGRRTGGRPRRPGRRQGIDPAPARRRGFRRGTPANRDLLGANVALLLEREQSVHHADAYLAGTSLLERVQRSRRDLCRRAIARGAPAASDRDHHQSPGLRRRGTPEGTAGAELIRRGYPVTIVCMQRFGPLIREIPDRVRVVRQPWWRRWSTCPPVRRC